MGLMQTASKIKLLKVRATAAMSDVQHKVCDSSVTCSTSALHWAGVGFDSVISDVQHVKICSNQLLIFSHKNLFFLLINNF